MRPSDRGRGYNASGRPEPVQFQITLKCSQDFRVLRRKLTQLRRIAPLAQVADAAVLLSSNLAAGMTATLANATGGAQID